MQFYTAGQRWYSSAEPELGLGTILRADKRQVDIIFTSDGTLKQYTVLTAPLLRAEFQPDDYITYEHLMHRVDRITEIDGVITYQCDALSLPEGALDPEQKDIPLALRLLLKQYDSGHLYDIRQQALHYRQDLPLNPEQQEAFETFVVDLLTHYGCVFSPQNLHSFMLNASALTLDGFDALKQQPVLCSFDQDTATAHATLMHLNHTNALYLAASADFLSAHLGGSSFMMDDMLPARSAVLQTVFVDAERRVQCFAVDAKSNVLTEFSPCEQALFRAQNRLIDLSPFKRSLDTLYPKLLEKSMQSASQSSAGKLHALRLVVGTEFASLSKAKL